MFGLHCVETELANINGETYLAMINNQVVPEMMERFQYNLFGEVLFEDQWWFQDGAGAHRARAVMDRLQELFGPQIVSLGQQQEWPPRSPDLTPCDFFLWGYLKSKIFTTPPADIFELRRTIINEFQLLQNNREFIIRAVRSMLRRSQLCLERDGGHVEGNFA